MFIFFVFESWLSHLVQAIQTQLILENEEMKVYICSLTGAGTREVHFTHRIARSRQHRHTITTTYAPGLWN